MKMHELSWPPGVQTVIESDADVLARRLAQHVASLLGRRLESDSRASLVVSGGSTPERFFKSLRTQPIEWSRVDVTLADERWVGEDSPDSNGHLVRENLLREAAAAARFYPLKHAGNSVQEGQAACESSLADFKWPIDVLVLGMGNDGHTASLFPDAPELAEALDPENPCKTAVLRPPSQHLERLSLTRRVLAGARTRILHLRGEDKLSTLEKAFRDPQRITDMPVRAFLCPGLQVFWSP
ncbi:6-phosphogluconolactonase [Marinobacter sp.]|uniref:6-phosphogluconolactonase n=1 Tax=Marinobacter sp. TaxID=50741 RepID=UPI00384BB629